MRVPWDDYCPTGLNWLVLPALNDLHRKRLDDLVVIGVHPPGSSLEEVRKAAKEQAIDYPVCIDVPGPQSFSSWGALHEAYDVDHVPHVVVIDRQGKVAATGAAGDMTSIAWELADRSR